MVNNLTVDNNIYVKSVNVAFREVINIGHIKKNTNKSIYSFLRESVGITATSRLLSISKTTVIKRIKILASQIKAPILNEKYQYYELDEIRVVVNYKQKEAWVTYAINRHTKQVVNFIVGRRIKRNLSVITKSVLQLYPKKIFTDRLPTYKKLIPKYQYNTRKRNTTVIERYNLTLRTDLKRLPRKAICYSKNFKMLEASLKLYLWGYQLDF